MTRGLRVIGAQARRQMGVMLDEIQNGDFAREWMAEANAGRPRLGPALERASAHPMEAARRRALGLREPPA